ncbi:short chain dehydrogenase [Aaosphaeria arxii CBS 175.79]|uniref:Short chain dehydrogenase n=1 Tax=Aaosphaeria arxii CBS 175.79 TaxID=1450172 RepID=A0A6A5Y778_9PLEO|nr:short chain dehydrogenase [Aaosphaeria arxii CBS 175.79]KAF2020601.1 short chain dehydrogenase [Aaosphaeria arxii CBS 175.79]
MPPTPTLEGKTVFVTGGSSGLGLEIAKIVAAQGAHVAIFSRRQKVLDAAKKEILAVRLHENQEVSAIAVDLSNAKAVRATFGSLKLVPDILYCAAGGCQTECGFLTEISSEDLDSCMRNNYYTAAYVSQVVLKIWRGVENKPELRGRTKERRIVFINSVGAFVGLPGYTAYTPSKAAVRGLADTLRMEALYYSNPGTKYTIQCAFPSNIMTDAFIEEQKNKPQLTKEMEETNKDLDELKKKLPSAAKVAQYIVSRLNSDDFAICDSLASELLWSNMIGPSPKRGLGVADSILSFLVGTAIWPFQRRRWDKMCVQAGQ